MKQSTESWYEGLFRSVFPIAHADCGSRFARERPAIWEYRLLNQHRWPHGMRVVAIPNPPQTLLFGEKRTLSRHIHMDVDQGKRGNDFEEIEHARHGKGSNFGFVDGSARFILKYKELYPENLWAVMDSDRYPPGPPQGLP